jgi:hypothetical protein
VSKKNYYQEKLISDLVLQREAELKEIDKKVRDYLDKKGFYKLGIEKKTEFLLEEQGLALVEGMAKNNMSIIEIASALQITQKTLHDLLKENAELYDAIDRGRNSELDLVEKALFELAKDRVVIEKRTQTIVNSRSQRTTEKEETYERVIPANFQAVSYILNRKRHLEYKSQLEEDLQGGKPLSFVVKIAGAENDDESN